jgi:hypothetical protein
MRTATIKIKQTEEVGHIFHFTEDLIDPKKDYFVRARGHGKGYAGRLMKGSQIELIRTNK